MALSILIINPQSNNQEVWELPADTIKWIEELNKVRVGSVNCPFPAMREVAVSTHTTVNYIIAGGPREIHLIDPSFSPSLLFRGVLRTFHYSATNSEPLTITLDFADLGSLLDRRMGQEYAFYDQVPAAQIFQSELAYTNNISDTGLRMATLPTTKARQRTVEHTNLFELLSGMSNSKTKDGFDFQVDNQGIINIYQPQMGIERSDVVFDTRNSRQPQVEGRLVGLLANKIYVHGGQETDANGEITQEAITVTVEDTQAQSVWGLQESELSATDVSTAPFLTQRGQAQLAKYSTPAMSAGYSVNHIQEVLPIDAYNLGDIIGIQWPMYDMNNTQLRVIKKTYQWDRGGYQCWAGMTAMLDGSYIPGVN